MKHNAPPLNGARSEQTIGGSGPRSCIGRACRGSSKSGQRCRTSRSDCTGNAQRIRANVTSQADEQQALLAEADARTAAAEAKVQRLEADRARLTQENRELQAQKVGTKLR